MKFNCFIFCTIGYRISENSFEIYLNSSWSSNTTSYMQSYTIFPNCDRISSYTELIQAVYMLVNDENTPKCGGHSLCQNFYCIRSMLVQHTTQIRSSFKSHGNDRVLFSLMMSVVQRSWSINDNERTVSDCFFQKVHLLEIDFA